MRRGAPQRLLYSVDPSLGGSTSRALEVATALQDLVPGLDVLVATPASEALLFTRRGLRVALHLPDPDSTTVALTPRERGRRALARDLVCFSRILPGLARLRPTACVHDGPTLPAALALGPGSRRLLILEDRRGPLPSPSDGGPELASRTTLRALAYLALRLGARGLFLGRPDLLDGRRREWMGRRCRVVGALPGPSPGDGIQDFLVVVCADGASAARTIHELAARAFPLLLETIPQARMALVNADGLGQVLTRETPRPFEEEGTRNPLTVRELLGLAHAPMVEATSHLLGLARQVGRQFLALVPGSQEPEAPPGRAGILRLDGDDPVGRMAAWCRSALSLPPRRLEVTEVPWVSPEPDILARAILDATEVAPF